MSTSSKINRELILCKDLTVESLQSIISLLNRSVLAQHYIHTFIYIKIVFKESKHYVSDFG